MSTMVMVAVCVLLTVVAVMAYSVGRETGRIEERTYWRGEYDELREKYLSEIDRRR